MVENWYHIKSDYIEKGDDLEEVTILATSQECLEALILELKTISDLKQQGRYELRINIIDDDEFEKFTHIEVSNDVPDDVDENVLYSSQDALELLVKECEDIAKINRLARYELRTSGLSSEANIPFTYLDIGEKPPKQEQKNSDSGSGFPSKVLIIVLILFSILGFALYGFIKFIQNLL